ncbi:MAG: hypothetical protein EKK37_09660 [Sphingobacteriales bacterium]|nr:MAG: hypothetical protein EKK37_09660 [Sphingobacteriales bacterium]
MKKIILSSCVIIVLTLTATSQITKGFWFLSGNANFSTLKSASDASVKYKQTDIQISGSVGHFVLDKFAVGLRPWLGYGSNNLGNSSTVFNIGPFVRYYILPSGKIVNIITDASFSHGFFSGGNNSNTLSFYAGPVIYFNTSVGMEFLLGYSTIKNVGYAGHDSRTQLAIGFQFHLEKEK